MANAQSVFISYSSKNIVEVNQVIELLKKLGISYWKAPEMIPAGSNYAREIPKAICECGVFLLIISDDSQESIWVEKEIDCAINHRKTVVPLKICAGNLCEMFRFYLNNVQTINYLENPDKAMEQLKKRLVALLNIQESPKPMLQQIPSQVSKQVSKQEPLQTQMTDLHVEKKSKSTPKRRNMDALSINAQPIFCKECEGELETISRGEYRCIRCGTINYDYFHQIRNFLDKEGPCPITVIAKKTGVPRRSIEYFLNQEMLEIPSGSAIRLMCQNCGAAIRTGQLCDACKEKKVVVKDDGISNNRYRIWRDPSRKL